MYIHGTFILQIFQVAIFLYSWTIDSIVSIMMLVYLDFNSWDSQVWGNIVVAIMLALIAFAFFLGKLTLNISFLKQGYKAIPDMKSDIAANKKTAGISDKTLTSIDDKIDRMIDKFDAVLFRSVAGPASPIRLTPRGERVLKQSKVAIVIQEKYDFIIEQVKNKIPKNAYQTQEVLFDVVAQLRKDETLIDRLENGAFLSGSDVEIVLYAGAVDIRDRVVKELGFILEDIDKEKTEQNEQD